MTALPARPHRTLADTSRDRIVKAAEDLTEVYVDHNLLGQIDPGTVHGAAMLALLDAVHEYRYHLGR